MTRALCVTLLAAVAASVAQALLGLEFNYYPRCYYSDGTLCPLSSIEIPEPKTSALVFPGGKTRCAFNDFMSDQAGLLTNGTFFFELMPKPSSKKLMIYWQGGGACLDDVTCNFAFQCASPTRTFATFPFPYDGGILNPRDPMNPFHDWNIVHIPYCTGDLHAGNKVAPATEDPILSLFNRPDCLGQNQTTNLRGLENSVATLKWARANFPDVEHIVLSGTSAGSLASQLLSSYVSDLWDVKASGKRLSIVADSYVGVLPANREAGKVLNYFGTCDADIKLPPSVASACKDESLTVKQFGTTVLSTHPHIEWLFINSKGDSTQRLFYELARVGPFGFPFPNMPTAEEFYEEMVKILDSYKAVSSKVTTFFSPGTDHTLVLDNFWYDRLSVEGEKMGDVIRRFLRASNSPTLTPSPTSPANPSQQPTQPTSNPSQQPTKPTSNPSQQPTKPTSNPSQQPPASSSPPDRPSC
ncbi:hypothetical protein PINS_up000862 [Pythium insidiosum]|nr:hypothetical protein PINS_up000862 [Pythium insidiosum]